MNFSVDYLLAENQTLVVCLVLNINFGPSPVKHRHYRR